MMLVSGQEAPLPHPALVSESVVRIVWVTLVARLPISQLTVLEMMPPRISVVGARPGFPPRLRAVFRQ